MGVCCSNRVTEESENYLMDIISNLRICKFSYQYIKTLLLKITKKKIIKDKYYIENEFQDLFMDDIVENPYYTIHRKIYSEFIFIFKDKINIYEIILYIYPLLNQENSNISENYKEILINLYGENIS